MTHRDEDEEIIDTALDTLAWQRREIDRLKAEVEGLREVLRGVTPPAHFGESEQSKAWWAKARAALGEK